MDYYDVNMDDVASQGLKGQNTEGVCESLCSDNRSLPWRRSTGTWTMQQQGRFTVLPPYWDPQSTRLESGREQGELGTRITRIMEVFTDEETSQRGCSFDSSTFGPAPLRRSADSQL